MILPDSWLLYCQLKSKYFLALAQYHKGLAHETEQQYGPAVARLVRAEQVAKDVQKDVKDFTYTFSASSTPTLAPDAASTLAEIIKKLSTLIAEKKASISRDNDMVYHDIVPSSETLEEIEKVAAVKPILFSELYPPEEVARVVGNDIFTKLVPLAVTEAASLYSEEKAKILRTDGDVVRQADQTLQITLKDANVPKSLDSLLSDDDMTTELEQYMHLNADTRAAATYVNEAELKQAMAKTVELLETLRIRTGQQLDTLKRVLDEEQLVCEQARAS